jgi:hypothetical protein
MTAYLNLIGTELTVDEDEIIRSCSGPSELHRFLEYREREYRNRQCRSDYMHQYIPDRQTTQSVPKLTFYQKLQADIDDWLKEVRSL